MEESLALLGLAVVLFAATNIDDVFILLAYLAAPHMRPANVVAGQFLGIGVLVLISFAASRIALVLAPAYVGLLGLLPIIIGVAALWDDADEDAADVPREHSVWRQVGTVAVVTIANGGDNIGVYTPVFAVHGARDIVLITLAFAAMTAAWCLLARYLVFHPAIGAPLRRYAARLLPWVLILVGVLVLLESGTFQLAAGWLR